MLYVSKGARSWWTSADGYGMKSILCRRLLGFQAAITDSNRGILSSGKSGVGLGSERQ